VVYRHEYTYSLEEWKAVYIVMVNSASERNRLADESRIEVVLTRSTSQTYEQW